METTFRRLNVTGGNNVVQNSTTAPDSEQRSPRPARLFCPRLPSSSSRNAVPEAISHQTLTQVLPRALPHAHRRQGCGDLKLNIESPTSARHVKPIRSLWRVPSCWHPVLQPSTQRKFRRLRKPPLAVAKVMSRSHSCRRRLGDPIIGRRMVRMAGCVAGKSPKPVTAATVADLAPLWGVVPGDRKSQWMVLRESSTRAGRCFGVVASSTQKLDLPVHVKMAVSATSLMRKSNPTPGNGVHIRAV